MARSIEAYVGEYASGKSECAVNRALELLKMKDISFVGLKWFHPSL
ncbi:MAG: hypothetical protein M0T74_00210 [Desulfitobacterium hafniense]|nr:hypothetical protein [Desulfitobacterium hafniense]